MARCVSLRVVASGVAGEALLGGPIIDPLVLPPPANKTGKALALVIIQGAECPAAGYKAVAAAIQSASSFAVWVAIPQFALDTPEPAAYGAQFGGALKALAKAGMVANRTAVLAHSLGGVMTQVTCETWRRVSA